MASALSATLLSSARSLVLLQLGSRILTFILNQALLTYASSEVFGTAAVQFDLLGSTLLFLSREGIRGALLREPGSTRQTDQATGVEQDALNLSLVPLPIFITLAGVLVPCYVSTSPSATIGQPFFFPSLALHLLAYLFELLSEPYYIQLQRQLRLNIRVQAEGAAVIVRAIVTLAVVRRLGASHALLAFGIGQACYGACLLARFAHAFGWKALSMWAPRRLDQVSVQVSQRPFTASYVDPDTSTLARAMTLQSVLKHFLTEGDRIIVSRVSPLKNQGGYAIATNYGSLIARIVFQPLEETARLYFSRTASQSAPASKEAAASCSPATQRSSRLLTTLLRLSVYLGILFPAFGPPFISTLLPHLIPWSAARLSTPIQILKAYMLYLPLLSANGMLEAFFASTADRTDLQRQSRAMVLFSGAFLFTAGVCAKGFGRAEEGLVWANCVNMLCRIAFVWLYARRWMRERNAGLSLSQILPGWPPVVATVFAAWALRLSEGWASESGWSGLVLHVGLGAILGLGSLGLICLQEWPNVEALRHGIKDKDA